MGRRLHYETPEGETIELVAEENLLASGDQQTPVAGSAGDYEGGIEGETYYL